MARPRKNPEIQKLNLTIEIPSDTYQRVNTILKLFSDKSLEEFLSEKMLKFFAELESLLMPEREEESQ